MAINKLDIDGKVTLLIVLWILDKLVMAILFLLFR